MKRVGADLARRVIQAHAVDASGKLVTNRAMARDKFIAWCAQLPAGCWFAMEVSSSAHHWARKGAVGHHRGTASKGDPDDIGPGRHSRPRHGRALRHNGKAQSLVETPELLDRWLGVLR